MQAQATRYFPELRARSGVLVVDGFGIKLFVRHGQLIVQDGIGDERRERQLRRSSRDVRRLVVLGHEGFVTLEALRWLLGVGISFVHLDRDGALVAASAGHGLNDPRLRRAQARAIEEPAGLEVARYLLSRKVAGQGAVLDRLESKEAMTLHRIAAALAQAPSLAAARQAEATAANHYWRAWEDVEVRFGKADTDKVSADWLRFGQRRSRIGSGPRLATNPANALLNYLYALLEAECTLALLAVGLDPGLGIVHLDQRARESLSLDLMEAVRSEVDGLVLGLLQNRTFRKRDFHELRDGTCRLLAPATHLLAETLPDLRRAVAPIAEQVAALLAAGAGLGSMPTPLTEVNRSRARDSLRTGPRREVTAPAPRVPIGCERCGGGVPHDNRRFCDACRTLERDTRASQLARQGPHALERLRRLGVDPAHTSAAISKGQATKAATLAADQAWNARNPKRPDRAIFGREIAPGLAGIPLSVLQSATGLSKSQCSQIRRGLKVPHPRHWAALRNIGN